MVDQGAATGTGNGEDCRPRKWMKPAALWLKSMSVPRRIVQSVLLIRGFERYKVQNFFSPSHTHSHPMVKRRTFLHFYSSDRTRILACICLILFYCILLIEQNCLLAFAWFSFIVFFWSNKTTCLHLLNSLWLYSDPTKILSCVCLILFYCILLIDCILLIEQNCLLAFA
jgi:hypothetical protein